MHTARTRLLIVLSLLAGCSSGGGSGSGGTSGPAPVPAPVLQAVAGDSEISYSWTSVPGAGSYTLYVGSSSPVTPQTAVPYVGLSSPHILSGLSNGSTYWAAVAAVVGGIEGSLSNTQAATPTASGGASPYDPSWASIAATNTITLVYDNGQTAEQNGAALKAAMSGLQPGDLLEIGSGSYSINSYFNLEIAGTAAAPITIRPASGATVVLTRPDANQNILNVGVNNPVQYVRFEGLELTGGSLGLRLYNCSQVWVDGCHIHHTGDAALSTNTRDTDHLYITRNQIHDTGGTGEGMYLGANNSAVVMHDSIIALNHVYSCFGSGPSAQGDGIELKQGSYNNWIVENLVHDTNYPCIIVYGTDGQAPNVVERNICYNSADNVMQAQGEAIIRNNLLINGATAFHSHDHQGQTKDLQVVHNTIINSGRAMNLSSWNNRSGMVLANNAVYSQNAEAVRFPNGSQGVTLAGNVKLGSLTGATSGFIDGTGLADFISLSWDASQRDGTPSIGSPLIGAADAGFAVSEDIHGAPRSGTLEAGAFAAP